MAATDRAVLDAISILQDVKLWVLPAEYTIATYWTKYACPNDLTGAPRKSATLEARFHGG